MPPWPSRQPTTAKTALNEQSSTGANRSHHQDSLPAENPQLHGYHSRRALAAASTTAPTASPRRNLTHGRSVSHPFPSLFGIGRKIERSNDEKLDEVCTETNSDNAVPSHSMQPSGSSPRKGQFQHNENDFVAGNCATCASTVRWPRRLDVYRCTICLMVNDLKHNPKRGAIDGPNNTVPLGNAQKEASSQPRVARKAHILSQSRIRALIDQSISTFLGQRVRRHKYNEQGEGVDTARSDENGICSRDHLGGTLSEPTDSNNSLARLAVPSLGPELSDATSHEVLRRAGPRPAPVMDNERYLHTSIATASHPRASPSWPTTKHNINVVETSTEVTVKAKPMSNHIFRQLENYLIACLDDCECLNSSFVLSRPVYPVRAASEASALTERPKKTTESEVNDHPLFEVDAKTLLLGDIGENGTWWTGSRRTSERKAHKDIDQSAMADRKSSRFDWAAVDQWYASIMSCGKDWRAHRQQLRSEDQLVLETVEEEHYIEEQFDEARQHVQRTFLKAAENLLRRPGQPLKSSGDCRFLMVLLMNPMLRPKAQVTNRLTTVSGTKDHSELRNLGLPQDLANRASGGQHYGVIKRILGLMANLPNDCHQSIIAWLVRLSEPRFRELVDLIDGFVSYRLGRRSGRRRSNSHDPTAGLIPNISGPGAGTSAQLHAALDTSRQRPSSDAFSNKIVYGDDWQIRVAAKVMSLVFSANNSGRNSHHNYRSLGAASDQKSPTLQSAARQRAYRHFQILPTSSFYNSILDYADLVADFETWESRRGKFSFCQYPMFLSLWAKIRIMDHDARRQMEIKARDAFFTSILSKKNISQYLVLKVRRDCLVDDSLRGVSEVVGTGQEEIKKGLKIEFVGEEGVDAGGLRKEWFLLLVREVFDPDHGLFVYDDESRYCYFNPNSFETSDQFFLVGVVVGLAIYNSIILDVALPPFAFRKLLASAPAYTGPSTTAIRPSSSHSLDDLAEWKPSLAKGLRHLLQHEGDVSETFCRDFVVDVERYGTLVQVPLCPDGEHRQVTNNNRREFVDLYIRYLLDTSVSRQYEPFKRGFYTVCGGNALSLFRPEEIELLVRGSDEPLDIKTLRAVAVYENWPQIATKNNPDLADSSNDGLPVMNWFWDLLEKAETQFQKKILTFITGSDRIPATGAASLVIKVVYLTDDYRRYPVARTCFNMIGLHQYRSREELQTKLWRAVLDSEGFGLR